MVTGGVMNIKYIRAINNFKFMAMDIEKILNSNSCKSFEDQQICLLLENVLEEFEVVIHRIEYFNKTPISGTLHKLPNGHFEIQGHELTCGNSLEIFSEMSGEWFLGRVEYDENYYFHCSDVGNPTLFNGMLARIRF